MNILYLIIESIEMTLKIDIVSNNKIYLYRDNYYLFFIN